MKMSACSKFTLKNFLKLRIQKISLGSKSQFTYKEVVREI